MNWLKTCELIVDGVQTLSKMPEKHVNGVYPKYITHGKGAYVYGDDGKRYIDYPCGLGAVLLGYANDRVNQAVKEQLMRGSIFSLPNYLETELAERIVDLIPSAEKVRFLKTGSEATSAAVKIARAFTGKEGIICIGYHGWHDWYCSTTTKKAGVPEQAVVQCKYNSISEVITAFEYNEQEDMTGIAAVIMEPYILDEPNYGYLNKIRKLCDRYGALLIFDEVVTGFRTTDYSAQKMFKIMPDLTCLGKAMANGLPISAVCGKKEIMNVLMKDCFVSSTFGGELLSIAAALEVLKILDEENIIHKIWDSGNLFKEGFKQIVDSCKMGDYIGIKGYPPRTFFTFSSEAHKSLFWQECLGKGVLFGYAQFISASHGRDEIDQTLLAMKHAVQMVSKYFDNPKAALRGEVAQETFRTPGLEKGKK